MSLMDMDNLIFPCLTYRKMVLGLFFLTNNSLCRRKFLVDTAIFTFTANVKMPTFAKKRQGATGKLEKWRKNHGHVVTFAPLMLSRLCTPR